MGSPPRAPKASCPAVSRSACPRYMPPSNWSKRASRRQKQHDNSASADRPSIEKCAASAWKGPSECPDRNRLTIFPRSEEHTSELQSLMRISYAVFCLKKKKYKIYIHIP